MSNTIRPIDRQKLDRALVEAGQHADAATRAQIEAFEAVLRGRRRRIGGRGPSLDAEISLLAMPDIADAGIFRASRSLALLNYAIDEILPRLDAEEDIYAIAKAILTEEIDRRVDTEERLTAAAIMAEVDIKTPGSEALNQTKTNVV